MARPAVQEPHLGGLAAGILGALFAVALLWMFRPRVGGCAAAVQVPSDCFTFTSSTFAIAGSITIAVLLAGFLLASYLLHPPVRSVVQIGLAVLIVAAFVICMSLAFTGPFPDLPEEFQ
jgi:hypothetical protein